MNPRLKKIGRNILFLLSIPGIVGAFIFANSNTQTETLNDIHIDFENPQLSFVTQDNVLDLLTANHVIKHKSTIRSIHINELEKEIKQNPWVRDAEIYVTANHMLNIKVKQKTPKVRINQSDSVSYAYYLDEHANPILLSDQYIANVPVVTAPRLNYSASDMQLKQDLVALALYIQKDTFWNSMISQINVNAQSQIELIPNIGDHVILLGTASDLDSKMKRLLAFYQSGLTTIDWNRYNQIDLRFEHQIVARNTEVKALVDKTLEKEKEKEKELKQLGIASATQKTKR